VQQLLPFWERARRAAEGLVAEAAPEFMDSLTALESALETRSLYERIMEQAPNPTSGGGIEILPFSVLYKEAFRDLNLEWLEAYFHVEPYDLEQLETPERILEQGGEIYFARLDGEMVGTGALYCHGNGDYEIAKMAVTHRIRGKGIGRLLLEKLIERFQARGGRRLRLATNASLAPAIALYRRFGFVDYVPDAPSRYERANVFMEWRPGRAGA
jgi:ribosomal protein S18 acetylase RimI-like enzyme